MSDETITSDEMQFEFMAVDFFDESELLVDDDAWSTTIEQPPEPAAGPDGKAAPLADVAAETDKPATVETPAPSREARIARLQEAIANACMEEQHAKDSAKRWKKRREELVEELEKALSGELASDADDDADEDDEDAGGEESSSVEAAAETSPAPPTPLPTESWGLDQIEKLQNFGLTEKKCESLRVAANGGSFNGTIRGLRDWIAKYDLWYRDIKGCGTSGAEKIGDALTKYVAVHPEKLAPVDEKASEAAAEFLGHTPAPAANIEAATNPVVDPEVVDAVLAEETATAVTDDCNSEQANCNPVAEITTQPAATPPTKPKLKPSTKKKSAPDGLSNPPPGSFGDVNREMLKKREAALAGKPTEVPAPATAVITVRDEEEAYLAGCEAGAAGKPAEANPYTQPALRSEWDRGRMECELAVSSV